MEPREKFNKRILEILHKIKDWILYTSSPHGYELQLSEDNDAAIEESLILKILQQVGLITNLKGGYDDNKKHCTFTVNENLFNTIYNKFNDGKYYLDCISGEYMIVDSDSEEIVHPSQSDATQSGKLQTAKDHSLLLAQKETGFQKADLVPNCIKFIDEKALLTIFEININLPPGKNEHCLCRVMFKRDIGVPIDWSEVFEEMYGSNITPKKRPVYDTYLAITERIKKELNKNNLDTDQEVFTWQANSLKRNY